MVKKTVKKKPVMKKKIVKKPVKKTLKAVPKPVSRPIVNKVIKQAPGIDKRLMSNFISLQKVLVNLSVKFDGLTNQISKLLELFEISAKSLAQKEFEPANTKETKEIKNKLDNLFEQNKLIARGLTLMHDKIDHSPQQPRPMPLPSQRMPRQLPPQPQAPQPSAPTPSDPADPSTTNLEGYEKSLTSQGPPTSFKKLKSSSGGLKSLKDKI